AKPPTPLDKVTSSVRDFYEAYPYPPDGSVDCDGYHATLLLSYVQRQAADSGCPLQVLEAGCGRGLNLRTAARLQPAVTFTGIDINRVAIEEASRAVASAGLDNLRFFTADLLDPASLPSLQGGYDLILSYGVIHHLSDPEAGLRRLRERLAPGGVLAMMVDGRYARQPLDRYLEARALLDDDAQSADARMASARALARVAEASLFKGNCWQGTAAVDDVEFADRCLHVHETSYDIDGVWRLLAGAGLGFVRWLEPRDWSLDALAAEPALRQRFEALDAVTRYRLVERLCDRPKLTLIAACAETRPREPLAREAVAQTRFRLNPQLRPQAEPGNGRYRLRAREAAAPGNRCEAVILAQARQLGRGFTGTEMARRLAADGFSRDTVFDALGALETREWLFRPHAASEDAT
ncbi:MAG: class I SAM-dependent methyltransferase, partial [Candidatus Thiodiazotropha sp.]